MHSALRILIAGLVTCLTTVASSQAANSPVPLESPDGRLNVEFRLDELGRPGFQVSRGGADVTSATLGLEFAQGGPLADGFKVVNVERSSHDETYTIPVGKTSSARDRHSELVVSLEQKASPNRRLDIALRAFNDGIAFRYQIPNQPSRAPFVLTDERTQFTFAGDATAHALPRTSYTSSYEGYYQRRAVSGIGADELIGLPLLLRYPTPNETPVWVAITEANLKDYAGMYLSGTEGRPGTLSTRLSPLPGRNDGAKVVGRAPHDSPWRVLMVADSPGGLLESNLVFHLNPPSAIKDTSWIRPGKTTFPWWNGYALEGVDFEPGVNTQTMKHYIDFCAAHGIPYHSLDGLDIAWYGGPIQPNGPTDITTGAPSIDIEEIVRYAKEKGVRLRLWMHWKPLREQIDEAFRVYEEWGIEGVMVDFMDRDDQEMVRFYHEIAEKAAERRLTVTLHGAYKPTGMERTWPNVLTYEGALNQEYNKWSNRGTPPKHNLDIAFVRMLAGPLDYHQGGMRSVLPEDFRPRNKAPLVQGARGHQLAMYVVYQNHLPMLADFPSAYEGEPGFDFLVDVPTNWDEMRVLHAEMGECLVVARRHGSSWYVGGMTGEHAKHLELPLDFLGEGHYRLQEHVDDAPAGPTALKVRERTVSSNDVMRVDVPRAGGFVGRLTPREQ